MRVVAYFALACALFVGINRVHVITEVDALDAPQTSKIDRSCTNVSCAVLKYSKQYDVDANVMLNVLKCESSLNVNALGDGGTSYGIAQIHLPAWPEISVAQAKDIDFAVKFMAQQMSEGNSHAWSCYTMLY